MKTIKSIKKNVYDELRKDGMGRIMALLVTVMSMYCIVSMCILFSLGKAVVDIFNRFKKDKES